VGWPGVDLKRRNIQDITSQLKDMNCWPVFFSNRVIDKFYHGFCNRTIWPLFHYFPSLTSYNKDHWNTYIHANRVFAEEISRILMPGDLVWIHDYHLMLLPQMLRERFHDLPIGFFLHIPFPSYEVFQILPKDWQRAIVDGLLGSNLIGFHTYDYARNFLRAALRIVGAESHLGNILYKGHLVRVDVFPMGIDFDKFHSSRQNPAVQVEMEAFKAAFRDRKTVLSIDRLDYTKGIVKRLEGYEAFLKKNPSWHGRVILVLVVVPSRVRVEHYQQMKRQIDEKVGDINGKFGKVDWTPILYTYRYLPEPQLQALYNLCDTALITPLRDGMNLVAKEYIASKVDCRGVLILSEMAGASKEAVEAILINPYNIEEIADAILKALEMPEDEQIWRCRMIQSRLKRNDIFKWASSFVRSLGAAAEEGKHLEIRPLTSVKRGEIIERYRNAARRLVVSDYDGTLVPFAEYPGLARPDKRVRSLLRRIVDDPKTDILLISGRDKKTLEEWFGEFDMYLVAEHGFWLKLKENSWMKIHKNVDTSWIPSIQAILERYVDRVPGSFIETKDFSVVWHFRMADPELASQKFSELIDDLMSYTANIDVQILPGNRVIEIRPSGVNKGNALRYFLSRETYDFILAMGDDVTDEDMFRALPDSACTIKVGMIESVAKYNIPDCSEALGLLEELVE